MSEDHRVTASLILARIPDAMDALQRRLPVPRSRLRPEVLRGIGQPTEGRDYVLTDDDALRVTLWQPNGSRPSTSDSLEDEAAAPIDTFPLEILTTRAIAALPDPPVSDQLLGPLVVRSQRTIIGAHTGEGKTTMGMGIVAAVAECRDFLDWCGAGGRALVIDLEQGLRTVKRRIREAELGDSDAVDYLRVPDGLALDQKVSHIAAVEELFEAGGYDLVYIDPFYKAHRGDSNEEKEQTAFMRRLDEWRDRYGFALLLSAHCRKPPPGQNATLTIHDLFGSSAIVRGAEIVVGIRRLRDGYSRLHFLKDRDGDLPIGERWGLLFDREHGFRRDPDDGKPPTAERLAELRAADPALTQRAAAEALGVSERTVRKYWHDDPSATLLEGLEDA